MTRIRKDEFLLYEERMEFSKNNVEKTGYVYGKKWNWISTDTHTKINF